VAGKLLALRASRNHKMLDGLGVWYYALGIGSQNISPGCTPLRPQLSYSADSFT
jgi:hypothetical protein